MPAYLCTPLLPFRVTTGHRTNLGKKHSLPHHLHYASHNPVFWNKQMRWDLDLLVLSKSLLLGKKQYSVCSSRNFVKHLESWENMSLSCSCVQLLPQSQVLGALFPQHGTLHALTLWSWTLTLWNCGTIHDYLPDSNLLVMWLSKTHLPMDWR